MLDESRGMGDLTRSFAGKKHQKSVEKKPKEVEGKTPQEEVITKNLVLIFAYFIIRLKNIVLSLKISKIELARAT